MANSGKTALVVVDMLNSYEHDDAEPLTRSVETIVDPLRELVARAEREGVELIYVNDNFGDTLDGYVRHFDVSIPRDGVAHIHDDLAKASLDMMERNMGAELTSCADVKLNAAA